VFAQAREQARKTSCLSNAKQVGLGILMYVQDYDERMVAMSNYGAEMIRTDGTVFRYNQSWTHMIAPYVKNQGLYACPDNPWNNSITSPKDPWLGEFYSSYGFNYSYLDTNPGPEPNPLAATAYGGDNLWVGVTLATINRPANTVMLCDDQAPEWYDAGHQYVWGIPLGNIVNAPDCYLSTQAVCFITGWGLWDPSDNWEANFDFPGYGGASFRHNGSAFQSGVLPPGGANTVFCDGHAKYYKVGGLVAGTNFSPTQSGNDVYQVNPSAYIWSPYN
jgi:prepilin-type processing-associated H-X9-DG protein